MLGSVDDQQAGWAPARWVPTTPFVLRVGMLLACVPIVAFALAVHAAVARNDDAVETVGRDATEGITVAQALKTNLAELDELVVRALLQPASAATGDGLDAYNEQRRELHGNLAAAAEQASSGAAYEQPLVNIDYAMGHYHALVGDSLAAHARGDRTEAVRLYGQAHEVMAGTLLPEADFFDKANTYLLNDTYDRHSDDAETSAGLVVLACAVLVAALIVVQVMLARRFHRIVSPALIAATLLAAGMGVATIDRLDSSADDLTIAREQAFDSVHVLARARATVVAARQAQGHWLLDPGNGDVEQAFSAESRKLFRIPAGEDVTEVARQGDTPLGSGGYLAIVASTGTGSDRSGGEAETALAWFGRFVLDDRAIRGQLAQGDTAGAVARFEQADAFTGFTAALDDAQAYDQRVFDRNADAAADATRGLIRLDLAAAGLVAALTLLGLYLRLREYRS
jgi:hypothetical protein